jgi:hypothetical protein
MKDLLRPLDGKHRVFTATIEKTATKMLNGIWYGDVVLLAELRDGAGNLVIEHLWVSEPAAFRELSVHPGNRIRFSARVMPHYTTNKAEADFRLVDLRRISVVPPDEGAA